MNKSYYIYILANKRNGTLYIGVTNNLQKRIYGHKIELVDGFTKEYKVNQLVYYEIAANPYQAIQREKKLKNWHRKWKINLIEKTNPNWHDLYNELFIKSSENNNVDPEMNSG